MSNRLPRASRLADLLTPLLAGLGALSACRVEPAPELPGEHPTAAVRDSAGVRIVTLSHSPTAIARGALGVRAIEPDLVVGGGADGFGFPSAVAPLEGGAFAVLDGVRMDVRIVDTAGAAVRTFGRRGRGPGELRFPVALVRAGDRLVLLQGSRDAPLAMFSLDGHVLATSQPPVPGDWDRITRNQVINGPVDRGPEDFTRRIAGILGGFLHLVQEREGAFTAEYRSDFPWRQPPARLIRYDTAFRVRDTVARLHGAELRLVMATGLNRATGEEFRFQQVVQPFFPATPVWAAANDWVAMGHGDSSRMIVRDFEGRMLTVFKWPADTLAIGAEDQRESALWQLAFQCTMGASASERCAAWARDRAKVTEGVAFTIGHTTFAERARSVAAAYAAHRCLFLAGHRPADGVDGTALTWIALNVATGNIDGVFRFTPRVTYQVGQLRRHGGLVRAIDARHAYVTTIDGDGESYVERFPLPPLACAAPA